MIYIPNDIIDDIVKQAQDGLPEEICGYLAGNGRQVVRRFPLTNVDHSPEHFSLDPVEQFKAVREARNAGLEIIANYHSHPETLARPSLEDIRLAYDPDISYMIVSLAGQFPDIKSFRIRGGQVEKEDIQID